MEGQEQYCGEPDTEATQKTEFKGGGQPSASELFYPESSYAWSPGPTLGFFSYMRQ